MAGIFLNKIITLSILQRQISMTYYDLTVSAISRIITLHVRNFHYNRHDIIET